MFTLLFFMVIWMRMLICPYPQGINLTHPNQVCKLLKPLYGLKQSIRKWFAKLSIVLLPNNSNQCFADHTLFIQHSTTSFTSLLIHVDDVFVAGNNLEFINNIKSTLQKHFHIKDLGILKYFLGLEITRSSTWINICQRKHVLDILSKTSLLRCKPATTLMSRDTRLKINAGTPLYDLTPYRKLVV